MDIDLTTNTYLAGIRVPDSKLAREITELVRNPRVGLEGLTGPSTVSHSCRKHRGSRFVGHVQTSPKE
jgi:hypothetical protein